MLTFESEKHIYRWNGEVVPSVTQILSGLVQLPNNSNVEYKRQLGTYVHAAIGMFFKGTLDEGSLTGEVKEYFNGFLMALDRYKFSPIFSKHIFYSEKWGFAGTLDLLTSNFMLYDWKVSAAISPVVGLQLAAYELLLNEAGYKVNGRMAIQLLPNNFKVYPFNDKNNKNIFLSLLMAYKWKQKNLKGGDENANDY